MEVNRIVVSNSAIHAQPSAHVRPTLHGDMSRGYLTDADIGLIKAATNTQFNWPPGEGEGAPQAAFDLGMLRYRQMLEGSKIAELKAADLGTLRRAGVIDQEFLTNALEFLRSGGKDNDTNGRTNLTQPEPFAQPKQAGTVAADGSVYL